MIKRLLDSDDRSLELPHLLGSLAVLTFLGLTIYNTIWLKQPFNGKDFGWGAGLTFGGVGLSMWGQGIQRSLQDASSPPS